MYFVSFFLCYCLFVFFFVCLFVCVFLGTSQRTAFKNVRGKTDLNFICDTSRWLKLWGPSSKFAHDKELEQDVNLFIFSKLLVEFYLDNEKLYNWDCHNKLVRLWENGLHSKLLQEAKENILNNWPKELNDVLPHISSQFPQWRKDIQSKAYSS